MRRALLAPALIGVVVAITAAAPAVALTTKQKSETCTFGANDQKLAGAARKSFMSKCMANERAAKPAKRATKPTTPPKT